MLANDKQARCVFLQIIQSKILSTLLESYFYLFQFTYLTHSTMRAYACCRVMSGLNKKDVIDLLDLLWPVLVIRGPLLFSWFVILTFSSVWTCNRYLASFKHGITIPYIYFKNIRIKSYTTSYNKKDPQLRPEGLFIQNTAYSKIVEKFN